MTALPQVSQQVYMLSGLLCVLVMLCWVLQQWSIKYGKPLVARVIRYGGAVKQYAGNSHLVNQLKYRRPGVFGFLARRFQPQHFYGLPLTFLLLAIGYIFALFVGLVEDVLTSDTIVSIDHAISSNMQLLRGSSLVDVFVFITNFGSLPLPYLVTTLACCICLTLRQPYLLVGLLVSVIGSSVFTTLSKLVFHRTRPAAALVLEPSFSFPSGHATIAVALYGFLAYIALRFSSSYLRQVRIFFTMWLFAVLIGVSRMVLNVHYLSDVLGGFLVGLLWLLVGISLTEWLTANGKITWQLPASSVPKYTVGFSMILVVIATLIYTMLYQ